LFKRQNIKKNPAKNMNLPGNQAEHFSRKTVKMANKMLKISVQRPQWAQKLLLSCWKLNFTQFRPPTQPWPNPPFFGVLEGPCQEQYFKYDPFPCNESLQSAHHCPHPVNVSHNFFLTSDLQVSVHALATFLIDEMMN